MRPEACAPPLRLLPFAEPDIPRLLGAVSDARFLLQWAGPAYSFPLDAAQLRRAMAAGREPAAEHLMFKAVELSGRSVGHVELLRIDRAQACAALGRILVLDPDSRGKGLGREIVARALDYAFGELKLTELSLGVFDFNRSAMACYGGLGFEVVDVRPAARRFGQESWTLVTMKLHRLRWSLSGLA